MLTDFRGKILTAPWIWLDRKFCKNVQLHIDCTGKIEQISERCDDNEHDCTDCRLDSVALIPGFVNAHSHAFHRCLRGRSQIGGHGTNNFWKWRQDMYTLVRDIDFARMKQICVGAFREMLSAGITTVGEFHYVHHADDQLFGLDLAVIEAALEVGIRLVLIETLYMRSGFNDDGLEADQWRFDAKSTDLFCENVCQLLDKIKLNANISLALAVHSLRAVSIPAARKLIKFAIEHQLSLHIHLEEQPAELEQCVKMDPQGREPSQLLLEEILPCLILYSHFLRTALTPLIAFSHSCPLHLHPTPFIGRFFEFASRGAHICLCPCTEGFLGDGVPDLAENDRLCLGTDCNNRIAVLEELRWLVFCQNMRKNCRNWAALDATKMVEIATKNGAGSLGLADLVGEFHVGKWMDCLAIDCRSNRLGETFNSDQLVDAIVFGAGNAEISLTIVAGKILYKNTH